MPRRPVQNDFTEDLMDEENWEDWETVSEGFGEKIEWAIGTTFVGIFKGTREVELDNKEDGLSKAPAAEFEKKIGNDVKKYWCWLPYQLKQAIEDGDLKEGQMVAIKCTGEQETKRGLNPVKTFTIKVKPS